MREQRAWSFFFNFVMPLLLICGALHGFLGNRVGREGKVLEGFCSLKEFLMRLRKRKVSSQIMWKGRSFAEKFKGFGGRRRN